MSLARARLMAILDTNGEEGVNQGDAEDLIASSFSRVARMYAENVGTSDEVMEEVWQMIMPAEEEQGLNGEEEEEGR